MALIGRKFTRGKARYGGLSGEMFEVLIGPVSVVTLIAVMMLIVFLISRGG